MKINIKFAILAAVLLALAASSANKPTIYKMDGIQNKYEALSVYCDAPRGNIIYIGTLGGRVAISALHQPEVCKMN